MNAEPARLPARLQPWARLAWGLAAITSLWNFAGTVILTRQFADDLPARLVAGLQAQGWSHESYFWFTIATIAPLFIANFAIGSVIFWLQPSDRMAVFTSIFLMSFGAANSFSPATEFLAVLANAPTAIIVTNFISGMLSFGLLATFFAMFPDGQFVPKWMRWIGLEGFLFSLAWNLFPDVVGDFSGPFGLAALLGALIMFVGSMAAQVWRYRHYATPLQKQQTKLFVLGLVLIVGMLVAPSFVVYGFPPTDPRASILSDFFVSLAGLSFIFLPLSVGFSILRYRLWDIDVIIRRTLQYTLLTGLLALTYFGLIILLQSLFSAISQQQSEIAIVLSTLAIAALFTPLRIRIQNFIDKRFYRKKYNAEQALAQFADIARDEVDMDKLTAALIGVVEETMQPEKVSLWLKSTKERK